MSDTIKQLRIGVSFILLIVVTGVAGYVLIEDLSIPDAFYMTVITISTTGFREVKELSGAGKMFTNFLIFSGVLSIAYTGGRAAQIFIESEIFRRRRMSKSIDSLKDHYIICGYGRMGREICQGLNNSDHDYVVIENDQEKIDELIEKKILFVNGDASSDDTLLKAGVMSAKGLVSAIKTDAENVFTTLSAKQLNPKLFVVTRAVEEGTESKLIKAGADRVVKPYELGGTRMLQLLLRPGVIDFIESVAKHGNLRIVLEEILVSAGSEIVGKTLAGSKLRQRLNVIIVAINRGNGELIYNPKSDTEFQTGDKLIVIGEHLKLLELIKICGGDK